MAVSGAYNEHMTTTSPLIETLIAQAAVLMAAHSAVQNGDGPEAERMALYKLLNATIDAIETIAGDSMTHVDIKARVRDAA